METQNRGIRDTQKHGRTDRHGSCNGYLDIEKEAKSTSPSLIFSLINRWQQFKFAIETEKKIVFNSGRVRASQVSGWPTLCAV